MTMDLILLGGMLLSCLWAVMARGLLRAAIALATTSVVLAIVMFRLDSPLAAVFELSVCAGLITVVFISAISLAEPKSETQLRAAMLARMKRYIMLPVLLVVVGACLALLCSQPADLPAAAAAGAPALDVRNVLWNLRRLDLLGQVIIMLTGVFGVIVLFKGKNANER